MSISIRCSLSSLVKKRLLLSRGHICARLRSSSTKAEPLRILYCGSDEFSAVALEALHREQQENALLISSIDVVCRAPKPSGRGLKKLRDVPLKNIAQRLGLPLHEITTFTGWQPPVKDGVQVNLIMAVSFGLLVPPRILSYAQYGGLNLHPSLLPELRGPAPLQHTIIKGLSESGISLQTLHPKHFDRGTILAQAPFALPTPLTSGLSSLRNFAAEKAADLLIKSLRQGVFMPPLKPADNLIDRATTYAPKITHEDSRILWESWEADRILRTQRAIGPLWSECKYIVKTVDGSEERSVRIIWHELQAIRDVQSSTSASRSLGLPTIYDGATLQGSSEKHGHTIASRIGGIWTRDGHFMSPTSVTIAGRKKGWPGDSAQVMAHLLSLLGTQANPAGARLE